MKQLLLKISFSLCILLLFSSCSEDSYEKIDDAEVDLTTVPYEKLSDYNFFEGNLADQNPKSRVIPYLPVSELFSDYALKKRFVWLPKNTQASITSNFETINLPIGSVLIKTFYYNNVLPSNTTKIIETRIMIRKNEGWIFADYVWNDEQTEAFLDLNGSSKTISWINEQNIVKNIDYEIPNESQCLFCHSGVQEIPNPIGIKPQNLNFDYSFITGNQNQLSKWVEMGYLADSNIEETENPINYTDETKSLSLRARSYLDINCAFCHRDNGNSTQFVMRFEFNKTNQPENLGMCISPSHEVPGFQGRIITPGYPENSMILNRMQTNDSFFRMPSMGRTTVHDEGVALIESWILSLTDCE